MLVGKGETLTVRGLQEDLQRKEVDYTSLLCYMMKELQRKYIHVNNSQDFKHTIGRTAESERPRERETKKQLERQKREREEERKERETLTAALDAAKNKGKKLEEVGENYCRICVLGIIYIKGGT